MSATLLPAHSCPSTVSFSMHCHSSLPQLVHWNINLLESNWETAVNSIGRNYYFKPQLGSRLSGGPVLLTLALDRTDSCDYPKKCWITKMQWKEKKDQQKDKWRECGVVVSALDWDFGRSHIGTWWFQVPTKSIKPSYATLDHSLSLSLPPSLWPTWQGLF